MDRDQIMMALSTDVLASKMPDAVMILMEKLYDYYDGFDFYDFELVDKNKLGEIDKDIDVYVTDEGEFGDKYTVYIKEKEIEEGKVMDIKAVLLSVRGE